ncbi:hypothetical protein M9H77_13748 [Catharanthus roseus]|uniref:Uncharacterized protein n=1 Tax=Catharanthus roseus TaxID=4058 RepID=A0ACC0BL25_CATRO|nr:hypothetical protein M9H77_13748 [Catharanthus roseus]
MAAYVTIRRFKPNLQSLNPQGSRENTFVAIRNEAYVVIFDNVFSQVFKELIPTLGGFLINNCKSCLLATKNPLDSKFPSIPCPLVSSAGLKQYLHFVNDVQHRIYRVQGSLELSFRVIVIIRFRLTRNGIIFARFVNLIVIVIDGTVQHRRFIRNHLCYRCNMFRQSCCISVMQNWNILLLDMLEFNKNMNPFLR